MITKKAMKTILNEKIQSRNKVGTPTKKVKLNENDNESHQQEWQFPLNNLIFIKNISHTQSSMLTNKKQQQTFKISQFNMGQQFSFNNENKENNSYSMNRQSQMDIQPQLKLPKLNKRINSVQKCQIKQYDSLLTQLTLNKHNSTFPVVDFSGMENLQQLGQNIYLNQLLTLKAKISLTDANNQNRQILRQHKHQNQSQQNRLEQNYQIKQNLGKYKPNKEGFICLNKLQKIFYYVKKINIGKNNTQSYKSIPNFDQQSLQKFLSNLTTSKRQIISLNQTELIKQQIKLYNKDTQSHLIRFYQEWIQNNSLFMIYELGTYSMADKILSSQKLPQSQIWSIIYNATSSLKWIYQQDKVHMNIKPGNILKSRGKYKLSDPLVNAQFLETHILNLNQTDQKFYLAPQLIEYQTYLDGIDFKKCQVYSLGMCILQNITSMPRIVKTADLSSIRAFVKKQMHGYSSYLKRLLLRMIDKNYNRRPTFEDLICSNIEQNDNSKPKIKNEIKFKRSNSI